MTNGKKGKYLSVIAIFCAGLFLTAGAVYLGYRAELARIESIFRESSEYRLKYIEDAAQHNMAALESFGDFYSASISVDGTEFSIFADGIFSRNPFIFEFRWLPRVRDAERETFELAARESGIADFRIKELDEGDRVVDAGRREDYFPVYYIASRPGHRSDRGLIAGLDAAGIAERSGAIEIARDTAQPAMVAEVVSVGEPAHPYASRVYLPIYENGAPVDTPEERYENLTGFVSMLYHVDEMIEKSLAQIPLTGIDIALYGESPDAPPRLLYFWPSRLRKDPDVSVVEKDLLKIKKESALSWSGSFNMANGRWRIVTSPCKEFYRKNIIILPWAALAAGLIFTFLVSNYFILIIRRSDAVEALVEERTGQLRRAEERYRVLYESSRDAFMTLAPPDWHFTSGNPAAIRLFGVKDEAEFVKMSPWNLSPERQPDGELSSVKAGRMIDAAIEKGVNFFEWRHNRASGEEFPAAVLLSRTESEGAVFLQATVRDITELKSAEDKIVRANREWADTFNSISDFVFILDRESRITKVNAAFLGAMRLDEEDVIGRKYYEIVHKAEKPRPECPHQKTLIDMKPHTEEVDDSGLGLPLLVSTSPIFDNKGGFFGTVHIAKDISRIKKTEEELRKAKEVLEAEARELAEANKAIRTLYEDLAAANEQLKKIDQLKSDFISVVSHELRTPLAIMKEGVALVLDNITGQIDEKTRKTLGMVFTNIQRLAELINDLLDISKIESGRVEVKKTIVDINGLVRNTVERWKMISGKKSQELKVSTGPGRIDVYVDRDKIIRVLNNLVSNAIKFTPETGRISAEVRDDNDAVEISVSDTGAGISAENLPKVFEKFRQFNRQVGAGAKGTGLGLAICRELIALHEGSIKVESKPGDGSRFTVTLPKKDSETIFREHVESGIKAASAEGADLSIISVRMPAFPDLRQGAGGGAEKIFEDIRAAIAGSLRRKDDVVVEGVTEFLIILAAADGKAAEAVKQRAEKAVRDYLAASGDKAVNGLGISTGIASYPSDADRPEALLDRARGVMKAGGERAGA